MIDTCSGIDVVSARGAMARMVMGKERKGYRLLARFTGETRVNGFGSGTC